MMKDANKAKIMAIRKLIEHGHRGNEWQEASLLKAIELVLNEDVDISAKGIQKLIEDAKHGRI